MNIESARATCWYLALTIAVWFLADSVVEAQLVGSTAKLAKTVLLRVENDVVGQLDADTVVTIARVQGNWLWVQNAEGKAGWVQLADIKLPDATTNAPPAVSQVSQQNGYLIGWMGSVHATTLHEHIRLLSDLQKAQPREVESVIQRARLVSLQTKQLRELLESSSESSDRSIAEAKNLQELVAILRLVEAESETLQTMVLFPSSESRSKFEDAMRKTSDQLQRLARQGRAAQPEGTSD
ncbi:MAG: SH3 domain-containing protein [Planctomycetaceae bacterium]|nr:SH3 domain-containing protein [Planctomycetaceae bacterium]